MDNVFLGLSSTGWVATGAIATLLAVLIALFGEYIRNLIFNPKLRPVGIKKTIQGEGPSDSIIHRLIVKNIRRYYLFGVQARGVRVLLTYKDPPPNFIPIPLRWTHFNKDDARDIPQGEEVYVDLIHKKSGSDDKYEFCWAPTTSSNAPILKYFEPISGGIRLEFFDYSQKIGDIYLNYSEDKDLLKVVGYT
jgi:hypothetical protein